jgi:type I restriction enzyme S subunit
LNQNAVCIRPSDNRLNKQYLAYVGLSRFFRDYVIAHARGTANQVRMAIGLLKEMQVPIPTTIVQEKVASILSAYDDLIENNLRRIKILEEMAQNLHCEWFVKFRFPDHQHVRFTDSPLGRIPEGWEMVSLGKLTELRKDKFKDELHSEYPLLDLAKMQQRTLSVGETGSPDELTTSRIIFEENDILFGSIRPYLHKVALAPCRGVTNVSVLVIRPAEKSLQSFLAVLLSSIDTIRWADQHSTGTKMPVIKWEALRTMPVLKPAQPVLRTFETSVQPILQTVKMTSSRNQILRHTRDLLLPKLISGELHVSELDIKIPEANA